ncbi:hypothetical protein GPECTOR_17g896 [Gonium pectorale]|uniref:Uncharacterized protein n=1 Tax=Gonium pectorale TaxID=33097 RepID=A0A150GKC7_GONPE|nr:hypothetical protein GPECTOR_17g896 [Gonium pectorale]|eukprot:KXZ50258.1 hypothetical protein GPECTOR_17g896 [Gonium pectorale]
MACTVDSPIVFLLLAEGCDVTAADRVGATPLIAAAYRGHTEVCQQLLGSKQGGNAGRAFMLAAATRDARETAVHAAAKGGHIDTLAALAAAGADVRALDREGKDCLMLAAANDHPGVMTYLLQSHDASPARQDGAGRTALMHAAAAGAVQAVQLLLSLDPQPDLTVADAAGRGPLHHACLGGAAEVLELLSSRGMSLSPSDPISLELLRLAARAGHAGVVDWMLTAGIGELEIVADGSTNPVFAAVRSGSCEAVDALGRTPLGVAAELGDTPMCRHLVAAGANLLAADSHGRVPRRLAYEAQKRDTAEALASMARKQLLLPDDAISEEQAAAAWAV